METRIGARQDPRPMLVMLGLLVTAALAGYAFPAAPVTTLAVMVLGLVTLAAALAPRATLPALLLLMPLIPHWSDFSIFGLPKSLNFARWSVFVIVLGIAASLARLGFGRARLNPLDAIVLTMYAIFLVVTVLGRGFVGLLSFTVSCALPIAVYLAVKIHPLTKDDLRNLLVALVLGACVVAVTVLYEALIEHGPVFQPKGEAYRWQAGRLLLFRPGGLMGAPPVAACFLATSILMAIGLERLTTSRKARLALLASCALNGLALFFTFTRSGWVGLVVGLVLIFFYEVRAWRVLIAGGFVVAVILVASYGPLSSSFVFEHGILRPGTMLRRFTLYDLSLKSFVSSPRPIIGLGAQAIVFDPDASLGELSTYGTHNQYLQILLEQGLIGLVLYASWIVGVLRRGFSLLSSDRSGESGRAAILVLPSLCAILVVYLFAHTSDHTALTLVAMMGSLLVNQEGLFRGTFRGGADESAEGAAASG